MVGATDAIGYFQDVIGLFQVLDQFVPGWFSQRTNFRVAAALNGNGLSGADGSITEIRTFDNNQGFIGRGGSAYVGNGGFADISAAQTGQQQAVYSQIFASNDAICIPYVSTTWVDGNSYSWVGDFGYICGLSWYYSGIYINGGSYAPRCTWLDGDRTNGIEAQMLMIRWPSFGRDNQNSNPWSYCGGFNLRAYRNDGGTIFKRDGENDTETSAAPPKLDSRLIVSNFPTHNATELCSSETSRGPDLVSLTEGVYCNMETRETLPLCSEDLTSGCFHVESTSALHIGRREIKKNYTKVIEWNA